MMVFLKHSRGSSAEKTPQLLTKMAISNLKKSPNISPLLISRGTVEAQLPKKVNERLNTERKDGDDRAEQT